MSAAAWLGRVALWSLSLNGEDHQTEWENVGETPAASLGTLMHQQPACWLPAWYLHYCACDPEGLIHLLHVQA